MPCFFPFLFLCAAAPAYGRAGSEFAHVPRHGEPGAGDGQAAQASTATAKPACCASDAARGAAEEHAEELYAGIHARRRAAALARRGARHQRGQLRFENVEAGEEDDERGDDAAAGCPRLAASAATATRDASRSARGTRGRSRAPARPITTGSISTKPRAHRARGRPTSAPAAGSPAAHQRHRHDHEHRHQHHVQDEDADVEAHELGRRSNTRRRSARGARRAHAGGTSGTIHAHHADRQRCRARPVIAKMPRTPIACSRNGRQRRATARTPAPMVEPIIAIALVRCCSRVRSAAMRHHHRGDRARALQHAPGDHHPGRLGRGARRSCRRRRSRGRRRSRACGRQRSDSQPNGICRMACVSP